MAKLYPVVDQLTRDELQKLGLTFSEGLHLQPRTSIGLPARNIMAMATGEKRPPKKGEWYLSGAIVEAYRAPNDMMTPFKIATLVRTETVTVTRIVA